MRASFLIILSIFSYLIIPVSAQNVLNVTKVSVGPEIDSCKTSCQECGKLIFNTFIANLKFESEAGNIKEQRFSKEINPLGDEKFIYSLVIIAAKTQNIIIKDPNSPELKFIVDNLEPSACQAFYVDYKLQTPVTLPPGSLSLKSIPPGASIIINGESQIDKVTPNEIANHQPGTYKIRLEKPGYNSVDTSIIVQSDKISELTVRLAPIVIPQDPVKILQTQIKKHGRRQTFWLISTVITAGTGGYFMYEADHTYKEYLVSDDSHAAELHKTVDLYDKIGPAILGLAGVCALEFTIQTIKKGKDKNKLNLNMTGQGAKLTYTF